MVWNENVSQALCICSTCILSTIHVKVHDTSRSRTRKPEFSHEPWPVVRSSNPEPLIYRYETDAYGSVLWTSLQLRIVKSIASVENSHNSHQHPSKIDYMHAVLTELKDCCSCATFLLSKWGTSCYQPHTPMSLQFLKSSEMCFCGRSLLCLRDQCFTWTLHT